ncbi:hypothetical protein WSM22_13170 [Cytophagales bacterium WSM2-2]|nr:hypothetical protein WSM22_13170 [Cytophagales bacterium WSM2-2]
MRKTWIISAFVCGFCVLSFAQQTKVDSLQQIVRLKQGDAESFLALKQLAGLLEKTEPLKAINYYRSATEFPFRTKYAKEFVQVYNSLGTLYDSRGRYDSSLMLHREAMTLSQKFNLNNELVIAYHEMALNFMRQAMTDSARFYFTESLNLATRIRDFSMQASNLNNLGNVALEEASYPEALEKFIKAADLYEKISNSDGWSKALVNIGNIQNIIGQPEKAIDYTKRALVVSEKNNSKANIAYCHRLLGRIYRKQKAPDKALEEYKLAMTIYSSMGDFRNQGETLQSIGNVYFDLGNYKEALRVYEQSNQISKHIFNVAQIAYTFSGMGFAWHQMKNFSKAHAYLDSSVYYARKIKNRYLVMDAYEAKSNIYSDQNLYKDALSYHQLYSQLKDSINSEENNATTEELEAKYQNTKKQAEINLLQKERQLRTISLAQSRTLQTALITAIILLLIIAFLVFNRFKMINQARRQMEIERVRNQIARDLHDDMGSTLSSINIISQLALKENPELPSTKHFQRISDHSSKMMESMSDMVWSINPDNDTLQKTVAKMKEFAAEILEPRNMGYQFQMEDSLNNISLDVAKRKNFFLVFKEMINNAAKYSDGTMVKINISQTILELQMIIEDNGKGFDQAKSSSGNGLRNMKERAREINAFLDLNSSPGAGTSLLLKMPLT